MYKTIGEMRDSIVAYYIATIKSSKVLRGALDVLYKTPYEEVKKLYENIMIEQ